MQLGGADEFAGFDAFGADADFGDLSVDSHTGRLEIGHEATEILTGDVATHAALFLGLTFTGVGAPRDGTFSTNFAPFRHSRVMIRT